MNDSTKNRMTYLVLAISFCVLAAITVMAFFPKISGGKDYSEVSNERLIQTSNGYLIQFDVSNHEGKDTMYAVALAFDDYQYTEDVLIADEDYFSFAHEIDVSALISGEVRLSVGIKDQGYALANVVYHLK